MDKLLMLGTSNLSVEIVCLAKSQGIYTITTDYLEPEKSAAKLISDEYWMISTNDMDALEKKCREEGVTAVIAGVSEFNIECMMELCKRLDLPCYCTPESWNTVQRKHNFKKLCRENGVPVATDYFLSNPPTEKELEQIVFPVVVKPVDCGANVGMSYCYNKEDVIKGCELARAVSNDETVIVERMLEGVEYIAHYAMADGQAVLFSFATMLSQEGYPDNCYSMTSTGTDRLNQYLQEVDPAFTKALHQAGCHEGVGWCEMILDKDGHFYLLEMGYRMTGDLIAMPLQSVAEFNSLQWLLDIALGKKHKITDFPARLTVSPEKCACAYILWSDSKGTVTKIEGLKEIVDMPDMCIRSIVHEGCELRQYQYMIIIAFAAEDCQKMCEVIDKINKTVKILDENERNVTIYYTDFVRLNEMYEEGLRENSKEEY